MPSTTRVNVGRTDRLFRAILGSIALALVYTGPRSPWGFVGIALLLTSILGFCPLYALLGTSTRSRRIR